MKLIILEKNFVQLFSAENKWLYTTNAQSSQFWEIIPTDALPWKSNINQDLNYQTT